jgi:putative ABC transport system permease protein
MNPPRIAERVLRRFAPAGVVGETIVGDAREEYAQNVARVGRVRAWLLYWTNVVNVGKAYRGRATSELQPTRPAEPSALRSWLTGWPADLRIAARGLLRQPGFTAISVATLALGLGGSAAVFTLLDRVVLDPLPYPESNRLVKLTNQVPGVSAEAEWQMSTAQYVYFSERARSFESIALHYGFGATIETPEGPQRARGWSVTPSIFPLLGARAHLGRGMTQQDGTPGAPRVVVLSYGFWRSQFGGDPDVIGRTLSINGNPYEVVGVLESRVRIPGAPPGSPGDLWVPLQIDPEGFFGNNHVFPMVARLAPQVTPAAAEAELERLTQLLPDRFPNAYSKGFFGRYGFRSKVTPLKQAIVGEVSQSLWILFGGVALVLLIAAANVANLFLVRMEDRRHELAVRQALGANKWTLARHVLAESWILSAVGGLLALLVGFWALPALAALAPGTLPRLDNVSFTNWTVVFVVLASLLVGIGIALHPIVHYGRRRASADMPGTERSSTHGRERQRVRAGLTVVQVALALTLVAAAGLLVDSMRELSRVDPGFDPEGVTTAGIFLTPTRYADDVEVWTAYRQMLERVRAIPGVQAAGMTAELPVLGGFGCTIQGFEDQDVYLRLDGAGLTTCAGQEPTTPGYFEAMGIPLLKGRTFTNRDNDEPTQGAVIVSQAFADRFWPGEDPLGKGVMPSGRTLGAVYRVIGVVGDVPALALNGETAIAVYYPIVHNSDESRRWSGWVPTSMSLVLKTSLDDPVRLSREVQRAVQSVDPTVPVAHVASMEQIISDSTARLRFTSLLLGIAAAVALLLATVGLYGVVSYLVTRRTREIGIRIAIGAPPSSVRREVVRRSLLLVAAGVVVGLLLGVGATRTMQGILYGVEATDPVNFLRAALVLVAVAALASWLPARRAARVDPVEALRAE